MNTITMSQREITRFEVISTLLEKKVSMSQARKKLQLGRRQMIRLKKKVALEGILGLIHKGRGKSGNRKINESVEKGAIVHLRNLYSDFKPTFATKKLLEVHNIKLSKETVRMLMAREGLWKSRKRKGNGEYRSWRPRKEHYGEMQQFDGSYHLWFEDRAPECCLLASIDDATGAITKASFGSNESVREVAGFWKNYCMEKGKPISIYLDKFSTYKINHKSAVDNKELLTQFQTMMKKIGVELITAHSPEAKGRIERLFCTLQDRLVKELRLMGIASIGEANQFLKDIFLPKFNAQFGVVALKGGDVHRDFIPSERAAVESIFSIQETRKVGNDFTVHFEGSWLQLERIQPVTVLRRDSVVLEKRLDGTLWMNLRGKYLSFMTLPERPPKVREKITALVSARAQKIPWRPAVNHPWRSSNFVFEKNRADKR